MKNKWNFLLIIAALAFAVVACNKEDLKDALPDHHTSSGEPATLGISLTDNPKDADAVNVEIIGLSVNIADSSDTTWHDLNVQAGIYDLLELRDTSYQIVPDTTVPSGTLQQLRLILGEDNTIVVYGDTLDMFTPSAQQTGLKINIDETLAGGNTYDLLLDFDAEKSVVLQGNGNYLLKPVIEKESFTVQ